MLKTTTYHHRFQFSKLPSAIVNFSARFRFQFLILRVLSDYPLPFLSSLYPWFRVANNKRRDEVNLDHGWKTGFCQSMWVTGYLDVRFDEEKNEGTKEMVNTGEKGFTCSPLVYT